MSVLLIADLLIKYHLVMLLVLVFDLLLIAEYLKMGNLEKKKEFISYSCGDGEVYKVKGLHLMRAFLVVGSLCRISR